MQRKISSCIREKLAFFLDHFGHFLNISNIFMINLRLCRNFRLPVWKRSIGFEPFQAARLALADANPANHKVAFRPTKQKRRQRTKPLSSQRFQRCGTCAVQCDYKVKSDWPRECSPVKRIAISTSLSASVSIQTIV